ncbi:MAG: DUF1887 family CARF protein [Candidatus Paceibacterota bacterium]
MSVLCCLLSDQHVPNLLSVHHFRPDRLVLIESTAMQQRGVSDNFLIALEAGGLRYRKEQNCDVIPLDNISDFQAIGTVLRHAFGKHPNANWTVNLTGGTKPMSIAAYEFFKAVGARLVYVEVSKPHEIIDVESATIGTAEHRLSISEFLLGYGFEQHKQEEKLKVAETRARQWFDLSRLIAIHAAGENLLDIDRERWSLARSKGLELQPGELTSTVAPLRESLTTTFNLDSIDGGLIGKLDKYQSSLLTGGWLEVFLWNLLDRHQQQLGIWDVRLGIEPGHRGADTPNDFDIAFMHKFELNMIECKSGAQEQDRDVDALYKVEAVIRQFRALRVRSYLATTSDNLFDKQGNIKPSLQDRAAIYNCRFVTKSEIQHLAEHVDDVSAVEHILFARKPDTAVQ